MCRVAIRTKPAAINLAHRILPPFLVSDSWCALTRSAPQVVLRKGRDVFGRMAVRPNSEVTESKRKKVPGPPSKRSRTMTADRQQASNKHTAGATGRQTGRQQQGRQAKS